MKLVLTFYDEDGLIEYSHVCDGEFSRELLDDLHPRAEDEAD